MRVFENSVLRRDEVKLAEENREVRSFIISIFKILLG
jgi:hypothetical protein